MKFNILIAISCLVYLVGCTSTPKTTPTPNHRPGVQMQYPYEFMFICSSGKKAGFSAMELERIANNYI